MIVEIFQRLSAGFTPTEWIFLVLASIVAALVMRHWTHLTAAALIVYTIDAAIRFVMAWMSAGDVPANYALSIAVARFDQHGFAATLRPFLYFGLIALIYLTKRRYGAR
ncbi:hypothetical protein DDZ18_11295 [Marinicauda salina]|jgi:hypothetical protein|uniref:Uncharacterized protein n=1 Tax=Marinicauda salina TaxID=2135793 RepID=A0A2U2BS03_9PROT|nr:hypothetical protein [Marinicauda salina]PWE16776.1 hypothetical protein DDZ18_11295 [Marinicauda salina]